MSFLERWMVKRTTSWLGRRRRLPKDRESAVASSPEWTQLAACRNMVRRTARTALRPRANGFSGVSVRETGKT